MKIYIFECKSNNKLHGFTFNSIGENLPKSNTCSGGWLLHETIEIEESKPVPLLGVDQTLILAGIKAKGYFLNGDEVNISDY